MSRARTTFILGLLAPLLPLALVGCADDPKPKVAPEPTESVSTSAGEPSTRTAEEPRVAEAAFVRKYIDTVSEAISSGDTSTFLALSQVSCRSCHALAQNLQSAYEGGGHIEGGRWTVHSAKFVRTQEGVGAIWNVDVRTNQERWVDGNGDLAKLVKPGIERLGIALVGNPDQLKVSEMRLR